MKNSEERRPPTTLFALLTTYLIFGALHEFAHLFMASWLLSPPQKQATTPFNEDDSNFLSLVLRILLGRCVTIPVASSSTNNDDIDDELMSNISIITHTGWIVSVVIAILCHFLYKKSTLLNSPMVPLIAYITALEGMTTDLFGFVPHHHQQQHAWQQQQLNGYHHYLTFFCGNFGILLLNSSWLSIDGGRTALDVLEKMVSCLFVSKDSLFLCLWLFASSNIECYSSTSLIIIFFIFAYFIIGECYHDEGSTIRWSSYI